MITPTQLIGIGLSRQVYEVVGGTGTAADPWRAQLLGGDDALLVQFTDADAAVPFVIFPSDYVEEGDQPAPFSPKGDRVWVQLDTVAFDEFPSVVPSQKIGPGFEAITWAWVTTAQLGVDNKYLIVSARHDNGAERFLFVIPSEVKLLEAAP